MFVRPRLIPAGASDPADTSPTKRDISFLTCDVADLCASEKRARTCDNPPTTTRNMRSSAAAEEVADDTAVAAAAYATTAAAVASEAAVDFDAVNAAFAEVEKEPLQYQPFVDDGPNLPDW